MQTNILSENASLTAQFLKSPRRVEQQLLIGDAMQMLLVKYKMQYPRPYETYYQFIDIFCREKVYA